MISAYILLNIIAPVQSLRAHIFAMQHIQATQLIPMETQELQNAFELSFYFHLHKIE